MTPAQFATYVRYKTRTNSTTFTDVQMLALMASRQDEIAKDILSADEDILLIPQKIDLVANQREYALPSDILSRIKRVEAVLDGTNTIYLTEIDLTSIKEPINTEADITRAFSNVEGNCFYDLSRKALYLYSGTISSVTDGIKLWCDTYPAAITDLTSTTDMSVDPSTTTHGVPRALHRIWATGVIIDYKESREKPIPLNETETNYSNDLERAIRTLKHGNLDREFKASVPYEDGFNY